MQEIPELVTLIDVNVDSMLLTEPALFVLNIWVNGANKLAVDTLFAS